MNHLFKVAITLSTLILIGKSSLCQDTASKLHPHQLIQQREIYLNGGMRASFGGKSRIFIKVDLLPNTIKWFYSFSTSPGESGTNNLNLLAQLSSVLIDPSGFTSTVISGIEVPSGSQAVDVYLCDRANIDSFLSKVDNMGGTFTYVMEGTTLNTKQVVIEINDITTDTWYLGLKNPSTMDGVNIVIEVVAIVESKD